MDGHRNQERNQEKKTPLSHQFINMTIQPEALTLTNAHMLVGMWASSRSRARPALAHAPDVKVSPSQFVIDSWNPDFPQDDGTIAHSSASHLNKILLDGEVGELRITESFCAGPHSWLMLVPIVARVNDFVLYLV